MLLHKEILRHCCTCITFDKSRGTVTGTNTKFPGVYSSQKSHPIIRSYPLCTTQPENHTFCRRKNSLYALRLRNWKFVHGIVDLNSRGWRYLFVNRVGLGCILIRLLYRARLRSAKRQQILILSCKSAHDLGISPRARSGSVSAWLS